MKWKLPAVAVCALAFGAMPAAAQAPDWDQDATPGLNYSEFDRNFDRLGVFEAWDENDNNALSKTEFEEGIGDEEAFYNRFGENVFARWDADGDGVLARNELNQGAFTAYDADEDNVIEESEMADLGDDVGDGGFWDV